MLNNNKKAHTQSTNRFRQKIAVCGNIMNIYRCLMIQSRFGALFSRLCLRKVASLRMHRACDSHQWSSSRCMSLAYIYSREYIVARKQKNAVQCGGNSHSFLYVIFKSIEDADCHILAFRFVLCFFFFHFFRFYYIGTEMLLLLLLSAFFCSSFCSHIYLCSYNSSLLLCYCAPAVAVVAVTTFDMSR